jgi:hypothetical protein
MFADRWLIETAADVELEARPPLKSSQSAIVFRTSFDSRSIKASTRRSGHGPSASSF